ncbi:MAG: twin-arginine translocase TatA/TatE family subunit [Helicobacter sp.]|nr:twin-arginine translocase TatA/TatE family subunit [Helicobacter sp.]
MTPSPWQIIVVLIIVLLLFGGKKIPELMKGLGSGVKNFKKAIKDDEEDSEINSTPEKILTQKEQKNTPEQTKKQEDKTI